MAELPQIHRSQRRTATVDGLFAATGSDFVTMPVETLELTWNGIVGDFHQGPTRKSGGREPWYPRGTEMRNERQVSIVARDELATVADAMGLPGIDPEWIGANMTLSGLPMLSMLPASTLLFFEGGVTLKVDFQNGPCKFAGAEIARSVGRKGDDDIILGFPKHAKRRRGVVAWVERPGTIAMGEQVRVHIPEQWLYQS